MSTMIALKETVRLSSMTTVQWRQVFFPNCYTVQLLYQLSWHNKFALPLDRWWSSLGVSLSCVAGGMHTKWEGGVYAHPYALSVRKCEVTGEKSWRYMKPKDAWRHRQGSASMKRFHWSLSRSSLAVRCAGVSAFRFPVVGVFSLVAITTTHCTVHMSVAWRLGIMITCNVSVSRERDGHGLSVGQCTWSCRPR